MTESTLVCLSTFEGKSGRYNLTVFARSSPPGLQLEIIQVGSTRDGAGKPIPCASSDLHSGDGTGALTTDWSAVSGLIALGNNASEVEDLVAGKPAVCGPALALSSPFALGGVVFLDSVSLTLEPAP